MTQPQSAHRLTVEQMIERLTARGLLPCEHNLIIWQTTDREQWGAAIETPYEKDDIEVIAGSLADALEELMRWTNRGADVEPKSKSYVSRS